MNLKEYQEFAKTTAVYPSIGNNWHYPLIGLMGELGELANILKKSIRDDNNEITTAKYTKIFDELGDIAWYYVMLCHELKINPNQVLEENKAKLTRRVQNNTVHDIGRSQA